MKIGFIGLGIMGSRMAANLSNAGYRLFIYNRTKEKADPLLSDQVEWCGSPGLVAGNANVIFTMLSTPEAVQEVVLGEDGLLSGMMKGNVWIDCSTVNPSFSRQMAAITEEMGFNFLDAPVAGSLIPAEKGELAFLVGGKKEIIKYCNPLFKVMGKKVVHAGSHGKGSALKLVNNLVMGMAMYGVAEGLMLGEHLGLDKKEILDLLDGSPIAPAMVGMKKAKLLSGDYSPEFPLRWLQKDLHLAAQSAYEEGTPLPATNLIKEIFALAAKSGLAEKDFTAVYEYLSGPGK